MTTSCSCADPPLRTATRRAVRVAATQTRQWLLRLALVLAGSAGLGGCTALPTRAPAPDSSHRVAAADTPLGWLAADAGIADGRSGFRPLWLSPAALRARLDLIAAARVGLDLQTYVLADDATGHQLMRALREAAARGVRVRLLVDDLLTAGHSDLLLGLAAFDNVELRLYNPFPTGRDHPLARLTGLLAHFDQLNRRMHNKLFIADGRVAIVGGRNLADAYFMRSASANFVDFDLLCVGGVSAELVGHFDTFWNSRFAVPVQQLADDGLDPAQRRVRFDRLARADATPSPPALPEPVLAAIAALAGQPLVPGDAQVFFDSPDKTAGLQRSDLMLPIAGLLDRAVERVVIVTPYFLPSAQGLLRLRAARERGVEVQVVTSSLLDNDEPLVGLAYGERRRELLGTGLRLFELSSARLERQDMLRRSFGGSMARLHAKLGFIDDRFRLVGSMNLDPRSARSNTELALAIDSPALTRQVLGQFQPTGDSAVFEVRLGADGESLEWLGRDGQGALQRADEPALPWWRQLQLWLLYQLVPDDLL